MGLVYHGFEGGSDGTDIPSSGAALGVGDAAITVFHGVTAGATASHAKYSAAQASGGGLAAAFSVDALDSAGTAASTTTGQVYVQLPFTATANPSAHFYYYRTALPNSATHQIARFIAGTNSASGTLRQTTAGKLELDTDFGVASRLALTNALPLNTWVRIELVINYSTAGAGSVSVKAYNATTSALLDSAAVTGLTMTTATVQAFRVGLMTGVANVPTWYVDNIAAGDNANAEVGPYAAPANPSTSAAANLSQVSSFTASAVGTTASSASLTTGSTLTASAGSFNSSTGAAALSSGSAATADVSVTARPTTALFQTSTLSASSDSVAVAAGSALAESSALSAVFSTGPNFAIISHPSQTSFITANVKQTVPSQGSLAQPVTLAADAVVTAPPTVAHLAQGSSFAVDATTRGTTFAIDSTLSQTSYLSTGATVRTNVSAAAVLTAATNLGATSTATGATVIPASVALAQSSSLTASSGGNPTGAAGLSEGSSLTASAAVANLTGVSVVRPSWTSTPAGGNSSISTLSIDISGAPVGDTVYAVVGVGDTQPAGVTVPQGWTLLGEVDEAKCHMAIIYKVKAAGDAAAVFAWPAAAKTQGFAISYFGSSGPEGVVFNTLASATATHQTPASTPGGNDRWAVGVFMSRGTTTAETWSMGPDLTKRLDTCTPSTAYIALGLGDSNGTVTAAPHFYKGVAIASSDGSTLVADSHGTSALFYLKSVAVAVLAPPTLAAPALLTVAADVTVPASALLTEASSASVAGRNNVVTSVAPFAMSARLEPQPAAYPNLAQSSTLTVSARATVSAATAMVASSSGAPVGTRGVVAQSETMSLEADLTADAIAAGRVINVSTSDQLTAACLDARAGDLILLADGNYTGKMAYGSWGNFTGSFTLADKHGTVDSPIIIQGGRGAIIDGDGQGGHYAFYVVDSTYIVLRGFTMTDCKKGLLSDHSSYCLYDDLEISYAGAELVHLRSFSQYNVVNNCYIHHSGTREPGFGEGCYIGSANSNWKVNSKGVPDDSSYNIIQNCRIVHAAAESVDCKEGTTYNILRWNYFDGIGEAGDGPNTGNVQNSNDSNLDIKGNCWLIYGNYFTASGPYQAYTAGAQQHVAYAGWGVGNQVFGNTFYYPDLNLDTYPHGMNGYAIEQVQGFLAVEDTNTQTGALSGLTNARLLQNLCYFFTTATLSVEMTTDTPGQASVTPLSTASTMVATAGVAKTATANISSSSSFSTTPAQVLTGGGSLTSSSYLGAFPQNGVDLAPTLSAGSVVAVNATVVPAAGTVQLFSTPTLSGTAGITRLGAAALTTGSSSSADAVQTRPGQAGLSTASSMAVSLLVTQYAEVGLSSVSTASVGSSASTALSSAIGQSSSLGSEAVVSPGGGVGFLSGSVVLVAAEVAITTDASSTNSSSLTTDAVRVQYGESVLLQPMDLADVDVTRGVPGGGSLVTDGSVMSVEAGVTANSEMGITSGMTLAATAVVTKPLSVSLSVLTNSVLRCSFLGDVSAEVALVQATSFVANSGANPPTPSERRMRVRRNRRMIR